MSGPTQPNDTGRLTAGWRAAKFATGIAVTLLLLAFIVRRIDVAQVALSLKAVSGATLIEAVMLLSLGYGAKIARWHAMVRTVAPNAALAVSAQTLLAGVALNNVLPLRAGDVARVFAFRSQIGAPASALLPLMVLERLLDTAMLIVLGATVAIPMQRAGILPSGFEFVGYISAAVIAGAASAGLVAAPLATWIRRQGEDGLRWLPAAVRGPVAEALDVVALQFRGKQAAKLVALTLIAWVCEGGMLAILSVGFGFEMPVLAGYVACTLATLATMVPSAPGFFGTFHAAAIAAAGMFGADQNEAAAFAFLAHFLLWLPLTLVGLGCLAKVSAHKSNLNPTEPA